MPNDCGNHIVLTHTDHAQIERALRALAPRDNGGTSFFKEFLPRVDGTTIEETCELWDTKWDAYDPRDLKVVEQGMLSIRFDTAWSPPIRFYEFMTKVLGFEIIACYSEPCGMMIFGSYSSVEGNVDGGEAYDKAECAICEILGEEPPTRTIMEEMADFLSSFSGDSKDSKCHFCERYCNLPAECVRCLESFCSVCSMIDYSKRDDRVFCLDCYKEEAEEEEEDA